MQTAVEGSESMQLGRLAWGEVTREPRVKDTSRDALGESCRLKLTVSCEVSHS